MHISRMAMAALGAATIVLAGCVNHQWEPGPTASAPFHQASGRCKLVAMGAERAHIAFGSADYVAFSSGMAALGNVVRQNQAYNACMEASGFIPVAATTAASTPGSVISSVRDAPSWVDQGPAVCSGSRDRPATCVPAR